MTESQILAVKTAIIAELREQAPEVYFWDRADVELFDGGPVGITSADPVLADKFDMDLVAAAAIGALTLYYLETVLNEARRVARELCQDKLLPAYTLAQIDAVQTTIDAERSAKVREGTE